MNPEIQAVIDDFVREIDELVQMYGEQPVRQTLVEIFPHFGDFLEEEEMLAGMQSDEFSKNFTGSIQEARGGAAQGLGNAAKEFFSDTVAKSGDEISGALKKSPGAGKGIKRSLAGSAALAYARSNLNQDVNIDGVSTTDALTVQSDSFDNIEQLLQKSSEAIQNLSSVMAQTQELIGKKLGSIDDNFDDLITLNDPGASSRGQTKARQASGQKPRKPSKKLSRDEESEESSKKQD